MTITKFFSLSILLCAAHSALAEPLWLGRFSDGDSAIPEPWKVEQLNKKIPPTKYTIRRWDGVVAVEAHASKSMALLGRPATVDLKKTPILCWQWRIDAPVASADISQKSGDDYAARVYLTFSVAPEQLGLGTRAKLALARSIYGNQAPDAALNPAIMKNYPFSRLTAPANVLVMPGLQSANISAKLLRELAGNATIGPMLLGMEKPVQIAPMTSIAPDILTLAVLAAAGVTG